MVSAGLGALVPDGPLHPGDAVWALSAGLLVAATAVRRLNRWMALVPVGFLAVVGLRRGNELIDGYLDRPDRLLVLGITVAAVVLATRRPLRVRVVSLATLAACVGVWAIVPDTEIPLMAGAFLVGAAMGVPLADSSRLSGALVLFPLMAAVVGSAGRPARLGPAMMMGTACAALVLLALFAVNSGLRRRQRAGTPTTVEPGATSTATTAPAPTTAS